MAITTTNAAAASMLDALLTALGNACEIKCYSGTPPANADAALGGAVLVAEFPMPTPSGTVSNHTLTFDVDPDIEDAALDASQMTFFRATTSGDTVVLQGTVGESAADLIVDNDTPSLGQTVRLVSLTVSLA